MPDLVAADVTVTVEERNLEGKKKRNRVKIAFGDGAKTYPSGGVPLPAISTFGMVRSLDYLLMIETDDAQGIVWKYDKDNKKMRAYILGINVDAAGSDTLDDFPIDTTAEPLAEPASIGGFGLEASMNLLGRLAELKAAASAPAAHTMFAEAVGW